MLLRESKKSASLQVLEMSQHIKVSELFAIVWEACVVTIVINIIVGFISIFGC